MAEQEIQNKNFSFSFHLNGDKTIWGLVFGLVLLSTIFMFSASSRLSFNNIYGYTHLLWTHLLFLSAGIVIAIFISNVNIQNLKLDIVALFFWVISFLLFLGAIFIGKGYQGSHRSFMGVNPIELLKIFTVVYFCAVTAKYKKPEDLNWKNIWPLYASGFIVLQNMSSFLLIFFTVFAVFVIGGIHWKKIFKWVFLPFFVLGVLGMAAGALVPNDKLDKVKLGRLTTQWNRVEAFLSNASADDENESTVSNEENDQIKYSKTAISCAHFYPIIPGNGIQKDFLPNAHDDYIFAIIVEELGYILAFLFIVFPFLALLFIIAVYSYNTNIVKARLVMIGCGILIVTQAFMHIAVNCSLMPVTGQALPLISKGGTSTIVVGIAIGIIQSCIASIKYEKEKAKNNTNPIKETEDETKSEISD